MTLSEEASLPSRGASLAGGLLGIAMFLLTRRYSGINHDSVLYLGQVLMQRWPGIFANDLFFLHGSQDRYSVFPWLVGHALGSIDPSTFFLCASLLSSLLFAAASWYCVRSLLPAGQRYWSWLGVLCLPSFYGMVNLFSYAEQFFTPRPIAESLSLLCIFQLIGRRWIAAAGFITLAGVFHPLQALATLLVIWPWLVMQDRRWLHALWLAIPVTALAATGMEPFADLFRPADSEWLARLKGNTPQLFLAEWSGFDYRMLAFDALLLGHSCAMLRGSFAQWGQAALVGLVLGVAATVALVDGLHLVLPAGLQLWRVQWLGHWFAIAGLAGVLFNLVTAREWSRALLLILVTLLAWGSSGEMWLVLGLLYIVWPRVFSAQQRPLQAVLGWLFGMGIVVQALGYMVSEWTWFRLAHHRLDLYAIDRRFLAYPLLALGLPLLGVYLWQRVRRPARFILMACGLLPLLIVAALRWDARPPLNLAFERNAFRSDIFGATLPEDAQVFWDSEMTIAPWLVLRRASYYSGAQLAGEVFSRATAIEGRARADRMMPLMLDSRGCQDRSRPPEARAVCHISAKAMHHACVAGADRRPDFLVLSYQQPQQSMGAWHIVDPVTREALMTFRLYSCTDVMKVLQVPSAAAASQQTKDDGGS